MCSHRTLSGAEAVGFVVELFYVVAPVAPVAPAAPPENILVLVVSWVRSVA